MTRRRQDEGSEKAGPAGFTPGGRLRPSGRKLAALAIDVALVAGVIGGGLLFRDLATGGPHPGPKTAVIVDQLSLTVANPDFVASATGLLEEAGYTVDYYSGEQVSVDFYRGLPTHDYDLIILRVHSGITIERDAASGEKTQTEYVSLFTGEPYAETAYRDEQDEGRLAEAVYYEGASPLFAITPDFVKYSMGGRFDDTLIVAMGCDGLRSQRTAQAFLDKGASAFVSWSLPVSASHTDAATQRLLEKLFVQELTVQAAVVQAGAEVGPDPSYGARLRVLTDGE